MRSAFARGTLSPFPDFHRPCLFATEYRDGNGRELLSLTDPDSRLVKTAKGAVVGYNVQIAVDSKHNLIAEQQVHTNVNDVGLLAETAVAACENLAADEIDAVADRGYYKIGDIEACESAGVTPHVPKPVRSPSKGLFGKSRFAFDETTDIYACSGGHRLVPTYHHDLPGGKRIQYANRNACRSCPFRPRCTTDTHPRISRYANEIVMDRMAARLASHPPCWTAVGSRRSIRAAPSSNGWAKACFLTRRLDNVRGEFSLTALAYNMRRAINLVGIPALIAAAEA